MTTFSNEVNQQLLDIQEQGLYKNEHVITSAQETLITVKGNRQVLNFCANNYLGLSNHPDLVYEAKKGLEKYGFGLSSVRFICGTQSIHTDLESKVAKFLNKEDAILYTSCFDANGGLFETLLNKNDAIVSDSLNHASIIDGVRLCKAQRFRYPNSNMQELENILKKTQNCNKRMITTDGVFSMDGYIAKLDQVCKLANKYNAIVHVDDSHATGFIGKKGQGSAEVHNVLDDVDIITSTFGKALGGASGGFTASSKNVIDLLRQRSRPYLFSNSLAPSIVCASIQAIDMVQNSERLRFNLYKNTQYFRKEIQKIGFNIKEGTHPIIPIMIGNANLAKKFANNMFKKGIYVVSFSFPVVPKGEARIRVQLSAAHTRDQLKNALNIFKQEGEKLQII